VQAFVIDSDAREEQGRMLLRTTADTASGLPKLWQNFHHNIEL
jgi:hypothetical protein